MEEETIVVNENFWDGFNWENVSNNKISQEEYLSIARKNKKIYATFLGSQDNVSFFLFKPLKWGEFKEIRFKNLNSNESIQEYILNKCILWPVIDIAKINSIDAGVMISLTQQILTISSFLKNPDQALELILEVQ